MAKTVLNEAVCRQRPEMWPTVFYMNLFVQREINCSRVIVT